MGVAPENFLGATHIRAVEENVTEKVDLYVGMLQCSAEECEGEGIDIEVKMTAGTPRRKVIIQEVAASNATWVILDRHLRKEFRFYLKHIPCKVALVLDNFSLDILRRNYVNMEPDPIEDKLKFYSQSKPVPLPPVSDNDEQVSDDDNNEQSVATTSYHESATSMEISYMAEASFMSSFTSSSREYSIVSQDEFGSNRKQEESA